MKITVITVSYNSASTIEATLRSIDQQTHRNVEHIVVDGGSMDSTLSIVHKFKSKPGPVISEPDKGMYDAMNKGIRHATGDVIGFINSDDFYSSPAVLEKVAEVFASPSVDACYGDLCYVNQDDVTSVVRYWRSSEFTPGLFLHGWCPAHPTFYVRKNLFDQFGYFDLQYKIAADVELMARFMEVHRIKTRYIPEVLVKMRMGGTTNRSWSNVLRQNREIWRALKTHGLHPSLVAFAAGKLLSRGRQFLARPA